LTTPLATSFSARVSSIAAELAGGVKNVGLVYIDVTGVSRRAVIKSVAKGMVVGKVKGGGEVFVGGGDGGVLPEEDKKRFEAQQQGSSSSSAGGAYGPSSGGYHPPGYGEAAPPYQEYGQKK